MRLVLPEHHPDIGAHQPVINCYKCVMCINVPVSGGQMHTIAATLRELGRYHEALVLQEEVVSFYKRVLPHNDPRIGTAAQCSAFCPDVVPIVMT